MGYMEFVRTAEIGRRHKHVDLFPTLNPRTCRTIDDIRTCMRLRYQEYCVNRSWEALEQFPDGLERDQYDDSAVHILLEDQRTGDPVGTVRILYQSFEAKDPQFPSFERSDRFQKHMRRHWTKGKLIEISRFTLSREHSATKVSRADLATGIFPALALVRGIMRAIAYDDVDTVIMTVAPGLQRMLSRSGFRYHDIGVRIDHRGIRVPIYRELPALLAELFDKNVEVWRYITDNGETWPLDRQALERETRYAI
ncbi:PEP-CTERM/exosortase system-associated acyltransferase [Phaeobacter porticola]|uniref:N-acyl amino acid synthase, PEP-CTERM/exosortase system-associated n=1 Tax=Phaeobacter porticola TaxID=1844006 RepID=A0A1L3I7V7_9RHOB|nr:PEP-CTERM/exosortase system-associated acyltransferase [Phaeobacter porticola]APG48190.1 N-acyl amino acid synthase, PEP-CTERM/exosortase system-associated [Phaeobacter porticola]